MGICTEQCHKFIKMNALKRQRVFGSKVIKVIFRSQEVKVCILDWKTGRDNSVGIATRYGWGQDFPHHSISEHTQLPVQWVAGIFPRGKAAGAWRWPLPPCSAEIEEQKYTAISPLGLHGVFWGEVLFWPLEEIDGCNDFKDSTHGFTYNTHTI